MRVHLLALILALAGAAHAQDTKTPALPTELRGALMLRGPGVSSAREVSIFERFAGQDKARLVILAFSKEALARAEGQLFQGKEPASKAGFLLTEKADAASGIEEALAEASAVWLEGGIEDGARLRELGLDKAMAGVLKRGGLVAALGGIANHFGAKAALQSEDGLRLGEGLGLLPGALIEASGAGQLQALLAEAPGYAAYRLPKDAAVFLRQRAGFSIGPKAPRLLLAASKSREARRWSLSRGRWDLVAFHRAAIARAGPRFPAAKPQDCALKSKGTLIIVGGGLSRGIVRAFMQAAGGKQARIVVVPTALGDEGARSRDHTRMWKSYGPASVKVVHAPTRAGADSAENLKALEEATGIWFSGGRQWRLVDSYLDTRAHKAMMGVLERGGVIGGSSAGASIQAEYMVRGNPLGNAEMMSEGYERGLAFLEGAAVDQHFSQRGRFPDMVKLKRRFPQLLGIGIDEVTAVRIRGRELDVIGRGAVHLYGVSEGEPEDIVKPTRLIAGDRYDLTDRRPIAKKDKKPRRSF